MSAGNWYADDSDWPDRVAAVVRSCVFNRLRHRGVIAGVARELAHDASQEAMLRAHNRPGFPGSFESERHLVNWMTLVGYRWALDEIERTHVTATNSIIDKLPDKGRSDLPEILWGCIQTLEEQYRWIILCYYYEGLTDVQIGIRLFPEEGNDSRLGQRARKIRLKAQRCLRLALFKANVDPRDWPVEFSFEE